VVWRWFSELVKSLRASVLVAFQVLSDGFIGTRTRWALVAGFEIVLDFFKIMRSHHTD